MTVRENNSFQAFSNKMSRKNVIFGAISHTHAHARLTENRNMRPVINNKPNRLYGHLLRLFPYILALLLWALLAFRYQFYLKKVEDQSLFLFDWQFIHESYQIPGGFLGMAGSFFTQFLYLPWLGALIWVIVLLTAYQLTIKAFRIPEQSRVLAIIPVALFVIGNMSLGYGVFIMRMQDYFFAPVIGYITALIPLFTLNHIKTLWQKTICLTLWTAVGFTLFGTFALTGTLAVSVASLTDRAMTRKENLIVFISGIVLIIFVPVIVFNFYSSYRLADSWYSGLPAISDAEWTHAIRTPYLLALLFLPIMAVISKRFKENGKTYLIQTLISVVSVAAVWGLWFKNENFRTELAMSEAIDRYDWQRAIDIYQDAVMSHAKSDARAYAARTEKLSGIKDPQTINDIVDSYNDRFFEPTRSMVLYRDLALLKMNRALDEAFTMKDGGRFQKSRTQIPMVIQSGKQLYFQYGLPNLCYRWCIEEAVEYGWSVGTLKYMSLLSILTGEKEMAIKFLNKLDKTLFYRNWSKSYRIMVNGTEQIADKVPFNNILPLMCYEENMTNDMGKCEQHLIRHFSRNNPADATSEFNKAALLWAMRTQSIPDFWRKLFLYLNSIQDNSLPRNVQEAIILYNSLEKQGPDIPVDQNVKSSYSTFTQYVEKHQVRNLKESGYPYAQKFGKTFFYYYYFVRNLQTY